MRNKTSEGQKHPGEIDLKQEGGTKSGYLPAQKDLPINLPEGVVHCPHSRTEQLSSSAKLVVHPKPVPQRAPPRRHLLDIVEGEQHLARAPRVLPGECGASAQYGHHPSQRHLKPGGVTTLGGAVHSNAASAPPSPTATFEDEESTRTTNSRVAVLAA